METEQRCVNCHSRRRSVYRGKHCRKCYPWHLKARRLQRQRGGTPRAEKLCLMSSPERVQNVVLAVQRPAMPMKTLSIITEEGGADFPMTERSRP